MVRRKGKGETHELVGGMTIIILSLGVMEKVRVKGSKRVAWEG